MSAPVQVSTPSDREIRVVRTFDAPRALVWEAHTDPELVRRWLLGPPGWTMPVCEMDVRVGGEYRWVWRSEADGGEFGFRGRYEAIEAPSRIVHTEWVDGTPGGADDASRVVLELAEHDGRTTLTITMAYPTPEIRDQALGTGMTDGMEFGYARLELMLAERATA